MRRRVKATRLDDSEMKELSGVDHAANLVEGWIVRKRRDNGDETLDARVAEVLKAVVAELEDEHVEKAGRKISGDRLTRMKAAYESLGKVISEAGDDEPEPKEDKLTKKADTEQVDLEKLDPVVKEFIEGIQKSVDELTARAEKAEEDLEAAKAEVAKAAKLGDDEGNEGSEDILKALPEPVRKRFEELEKRAEDAETIAKSEREVREIAEWITKAKTLGLGEADKLGPALRSLAAADAEAVKVVEETLVAASEQIKKGRLFSVVGSDANEGGSDAVAKLESLAKARAEKESVTYAKAYDDVLQTAEGSALYAESRREKEAR